MYTAASSKQTTAATPATGKTPAPLMNEREAAAYLNCSVHFLRDDRRGARVVPFVKLGAKAVRYRMADVERAVARMVMGGKR